MTTSTTKDHPPEATSEAVIELPIARKTQPGFAVPNAGSEPDLESRIKQRRAELIAKLRELRADTRLDATAAGDRLKARLSEVAHLIKEDIVDGWTSIGDSAKHKLERWLSESARQLA